jgi:hypothetical protein
MRGLVRAAEGQRHGATEDLEAALQLSVDLKLDPLATDCRAALGKLTRRAG